MNKDNARDYLPLVQALAEGKTIQYRLEDGEWADVPQPIFHDEVRSYRIKPEPKKISLSIALHNDDSGYWAELVQGETITERQRFARPNSFVKWLDHLEYEIPEGDA